MSSNERTTENSFRSRARDLALNALIFGAAQIMLALLIWQIVFRTHPQGFAMGLTLVGFAGWAFAFMTSSRRSRRRLLSPQEAWLGSQKGDSPADAPSRGKSPLPGGMQARLQNTGCSTVLFVSSLIPLGLAFVLRVRADMQAGMTWSDIFPTGP